MVRQRCGRALVWVCFCRGWCVADCLWAGRGAKGMGCMQLSASGEAFGIQRQRGSAAQRARHDCAPRNGDPSMRLWHSTRGVGLVLDNDRCPQDRGRREGPGGRDEARQTAVRMISRAILVRLLLFVLSSAHTTLARNGSQTRDPKSSLSRAIHRRGTAPRGRKPLATRPHRGPSVPVAAAASARVPASLIMATLRAVLALATLMLARLPPSSTSAPRRWSQLPRAAPSSRPRATGSR